MHYTTSCCGKEIPPRRGAKTLVLVGEAGNGKSATGNSILGHHVFDSMPSLGGVTSACQLQTTILDDGQILNVIDTPGLFDSSVEHKVMATKIAECIEMAKDGIHALLLVISLRNRFSEEEALVFDSLCQIFGGKIADHMIVAFTHGDVLGKKHCLDDFLARSCPKQLMNTIAMCGNRIVLYDNVTEDEAKIFRQREELLLLVEAVLEENGGKPYTNDLFDELKQGGMDPPDQTTEAGLSKKSLALYEEKFERLIEMVELRLRECILRLEKQLVEERAARAEAEVKAHAAQAKSRDEVVELTERLSRAEALSKELQEKINSQPRGFVMQKCDHFEHRV